MASGPHDIVSSADGSAVRYKVYSYPEKKRKSKIKLCVRFDLDDPKPEREWDQFRDDGDPEAAVRAAARRLFDSLRIELEEGGWWVKTLTVPGEGGGAAGRRYYLYRSLSVLEAAAARGDGCSTFTPAQ